MKHHVTFSIWIASKTRWAHLRKTIEVPAIPRVGEFVKFTIEGEDDYIPWQITEVTHRESGSIEVSTGLLDDVGGRGYSFTDEADFDRTIKEYQSSDWECPHGIGPNRRTKASMIKPNQTVEATTDPPSS